MVLSSSITTIRPLKIPTYRKSFWIANKGPDGHCREWVLIAVKSPHQSDTNGQFVLHCQY